MKNSAVVILALAAAVLAGLAFREMREVRSARQALAIALDERNALRAHLAEMESAQQALAADNANLRRAEATSAATPRADTAPRLKPFHAAVARGRLPGPMEAMDSPEARRLMAIEQRGRLDAQYAPLFQALHLPPNRLNEFKQLLVDKQNAAMDVLAVAQRQELLNPGSGVDLAAMMQHEQQLVDAGIRDVLGETAYEEYQDFERTQSERSVVEQLSKRLSYTDAPLSAEQREALVNLLSAERRAQPAPSADPANGTGGMQVAVAIGTSGNTTVNFAGASLGASPAASISDTSLQTAQTVLSEAQLQALRELQAEQQAQQKLGTLIRRSMPAPDERGFVAMPLPEAGEVRATPASRP